MKKRYQVYLNPHSVGILDEAAEIGSLTRSHWIREAVNGATARVGNLLAVLKPVKKEDYSWLDEMVGSLRAKGGKTVNISQRVDDIYYDK